jgi:hypothetical protein
METKLERSNLTALNEDDGGGYGGDYSGWSADYGGMGGHGWGEIVPRDKLFTTFVMPFVDPFITAYSELKKVSVNTVTLIRTMLTAAANTLVMIIPDNYDKIFAARRAKLDKIKQQYSDVYKRTWNAFKHEDFLVSAFFYDPKTFLTLQTAMRTPSAIIDLAGTLSGGVTDAAIDSMKKFFEDKTIDGYVLVEAEKTREMKGKKLLAKLFNKALASDKAEDMQAQTRKAMDEAYDIIVQQVEEISRAKSLEQLEKLFGEELIDKSKLSKLSAEEKQKTVGIERELLNQVKKLAKQVYVGNLTNEYQQARKLGVPNDNALLLKIKDTINKIKNA